MPQNLSAWLQKGVHLVKMVFIRAQTNQKMEIQKGLHVYMVDGQIGLDHVPH